MVHCSKAGNMAENKRYIDEKAAPKCLDHFRRMRRLKKRVDNNIKVTWAAVGFMANICASRRRREKKYIPTVWCWQHTILHCSDSLRRAQKSTWIGVDSHSSKLLTLFSTCFMNLWLLKLQSTTLTRDKSIWPPKWKSDCIFWYTIYTTAH